MLKRKDKILISAIELLHDEGVNGVTTKNLARLQGVTEPALYRQYKSKQDILKHIIEEYSNYDEKICNTIIEQDIKGKKAIQFYVKCFAELYENYSELTTVMFSMDLYQYNNETKSRMKEIFEKRLDFLADIINNTQEEFGGLSMEAKEISSLINGTIFSQIYQWRIMGEKYSLQKKLEFFVDRIINK